MSRKRGASEGHGDYHIPRKRHEKEQGDNLVHLTYSDDIRAVHDVVDFINRTMQKEWSSIIGRDGAIVNHRLNNNDGNDGNGKGWILEAASSDLANKVCNLNGIYYHYQPLKIQRHGVHSSPSKWCWNDYHHKRYGKNHHFVDHHIMATIQNSEGGSEIDGLKLQTRLNEKMEEFKLAFSANSIIKSVKINNSKDGNGQFLLSMRAWRYAHRLTYLNNISIDNHSIALKRLPEWKGEKPKYLHFDEFLKDHHTTEENRAQQKLVNAGQSKDTNSTEPSKTPSGPGSSSCPNASSNGQDQNSELEEPKGAAATSTNGQNVGSLAVQVARTTQPTSTPSIEKGAKTSTSNQDGKGLQQQRALASKPAAVEKASVVTIVVEDSKELAQANAANGSMKAVIAQQTAIAKDLRASLKNANDKVVQKDKHIAQLEYVVEKQKEFFENESESMKVTMAKQTADAKEVSDSLKLANEKSAQKDEHIAQLETIVEKQKKDLEDERHKVSSIEKEVGTLREKLDIQQNDLEEQRRIIATKEEETARLHDSVGDLSSKLDTAVLKLNTVHQSWSDQVLELEAKDEQIAVLNAKLERLRDAFLWQPGMDSKEMAESLKLKGTIKDFLATRMDP